MLTSTGQASQPVLYLMHDESTFRNRKKSWKATG